MSGLIGEMSPSSMPSPRTLISSYLVSVTSLRTVERASVSKEGQLDNRVSYLRHGEHSTRIGGESK